MSEVAGAVRRSPMGPAVHTGAFYLALFLASGVQVPFWPIWLRDWGLTASEVGLYTALGVAVRVVAGLAIPALADRLDRRVMTIVVCAALSVVLYLAHLGIVEKSTLLLATLAVGSTTAGINPIAEALGIAASRFWGFRYAPVRAMGSIGFLAANLIAGALMARYGSGVALWWVVVCMAAGGALAIGHPGAHRVRGGAPPALREIGRVVVNPTFAVFMAAVASLQSSHAVIYALGSLHWQALGIGEPEIGALWAASVGGEIVFLMGFGTALVQRVGPIGALAIAGVAGVLRWSVMMADPTGLLLWPTQALHALTFAACHLGTMAFISRAVPDRYHAAAQGATTAMAVGAVTALATLLASAVYPALGGATYGISLALSALGLACTVALARRWNGRELAV
jgi:PPP family 3-phenylpropionic acid transporter